MDVSTRQVGNATIVDIIGDITLYNSPEVRRILLSLLKDKHAPRVIVNLEKVKYIDSAGVASLVEGLKTSRDLKTGFALLWLEPDHAGSPGTDQAYQSIRSARQRRGSPARWRQRPRRELSIPVHGFAIASCSTIALTRRQNSMALTYNIGEATIEGLAYVGSLAQLIGGAARSVVIEPFRGRKLRLSRALHQAMSVGVEAVPIVSLISFFVGTILALQGAYQLRKLGAMQLVAAAVAIVITRELGPLMTAIMVIGRSGSAFRRRNRHHEG